MGAVNHLYLVIFGFVTSAWASFIKALGITSTYADQCFSSVWEGVNIFDAVKEDSLQRCITSNLRPCYFTLLFSWRNGHIRTIHLICSSAADWSVTRSKAQIRKLDVSIIWRQDVILLILGITARDKWGKHLQAPAQYLHMKEGQCSYGGPSLHTQSSPLQENAGLLCGENRHVVCYCGWYNWHVRFGVERPQGCLIVSNNILNIFF